MYMFMHICMHTCMCRRICRLCVFYVHRVSAFEEWRQAMMRLCIASAYVHIPLMKAADRSRGMWWLPTALHTAPIPSSSLASPQERCWMGRQLWGGSGKAQKEAVRTRRLPYAPPKTRVEPGKSVEGRGPFSASTFLEALRRFQTAFQSMPAVCEVVVRRFARQPDLYPVRLPSSM